MLATLSGFAIHPYSGYGFTTNVRSRDSGFGR
jgi:hypothetical protein